MDDVMVYLSYITILVSYGVFTIGVYLFLICIVVGVHEYGHYQMARWCNIKVTEFSLGFGKILFQKKLTRDETVFTFRALPLGGFVKPLDKNALTQEEWDKLPESDKARSYNNANRGKKILMIAGGPLINFVLAVILYILAMSLIGSPKYEPLVASISPNTLMAESGIKEGEKILKVNNQEVETSKEAFRQIITMAIKGEVLKLQTDKGQYEINYKGQDFSQYGRSIDKGIGIYFVGPKADYIIEGVQANSVAEKAGLQPGDSIKEIDGHNVVSMAWLSNKLSSDTNKEITLKVERQKKDFLVSVIPEKMEIDGVMRGFIGVNINSENIVEPNPTTISFLSAIPKSINNVQGDILNTVYAIKKLFSAELSTKSVSGPVAMLEFSGKAAFNGLYSYVNLMALISVGIGFFNLLPLPMLDGGQITVHTIEAIRRKDFSLKFQKNLQMVGVLMLIGFFFFVMIQDLRNMF